MSDPQQSPHEKRINQQLKRPVSIDKLDPEIAKNYYERIKSQNYTAPKFTLWDRIAGSYSLRQKVREFRRFSKETLPMLVFIGFSTYMLIRMENQYDKMKQKLHNCKTLKEIEIEQEDQYIQNALAGRKLDLNVQIQEQVPKQKYKFEDDGDDDDEEGNKHLPGFDTRDDFYEGLKRDQKQGLPIPEEYAGELNRYTKSYNK